MDLSVTEFASLLPWITIGVLAGIFVGAIPGLTGAMVIALALPFTFGMPANEALALLVSMYTGSVSGGLITAVLLKIPGTPASVITTLDGYPMTEQGRAGKALGLGIGASLIGGIFSGLILWTLARPLSEWSTKLGAFDLFSLVMMALVFIATVSQPGWLGFCKGILSGMLGCLVALPGMHPATGQLRFTFGFPEMNGGFSLLPVLIGMFAFSQAIQDLRRMGKVQSGAIDFGSAKILDRVWQPIKLWLGQAGNLFRSSAIGTFVGILPGIGANIGSTVAYGISRQLSRDRDRFGKGSESGLVASESANNATVGGALIPLVSLGIPGSVIDAILLGAFVIHGLQPGPLLFQNNPETVSAIVGSYLVSNVLMALVMLISARWIARLAGVNRQMLAPLIILCCVVGSFALANRMFDVWVMIGFGILGLLCRRVGLPLAPFVIGFVLAPLAEENLCAGVMASGGSYAPLFTRPFSLLCLILAVLVFAVSLFRQGREKKS